MVRHQDVRRIALGLPGAHEQESFGGRPSWRTKPRMFAWIREDPEALVVWVESPEAKDALISAEPRKFFTTTHYDGRPIVLVRLEAVDHAEATELITESWLFDQLLTSDHVSVRARVVESEGVPTMVWKMTQ